MAQVDRLQELRALLRQASGGVRTAGEKNSAAVWPPGGLGTGTLSEWVAAETGSGAWELAVATVRSLRPGSKSV